MIKKIPLLIASGLCVFSVFETFVSNLIADADVRYLYSTDTLLGLLALLIIWSSLLIHKKLWVYLFLIVLLVSFSSLIEFSNLTLTISIGSLTINCIALGLTISHFALNGETLTLAGKTDAEINDDYENKVKFFLNKFASKSKDELVTMENKDHVPEAIEAIKRLLLERMPIQKKLTPFVRDSIRFVLESYDSNADLVSQIQFLEIIKKEHTTRGCFYSFHANTAKKLLFDTEDNSIYSDGCTVCVDDIGLEASLTVWMEEGKIKCLEVLAHTGDFPSVDPEKYSFKTNSVNYIDLA